MAAHGGALKEVAEDDESERFKRWQKTLSFYYPMRRAAFVDENNIGHIHILGALAQGLPMVDKLFMTCFDEIREEVSSLLEQGVGGIMVEADSPGGTVHGTPETAALFSSLKIPVGVHTRSLLASACYYMLAGADFISGTVSASVGSIGVIVPWRDVAGLWERFGVKWDPVISQGSDLKGMGAGPSLTDEHRDELQRMVDASLSDFKGHVLASRQVDDSAIRGQTLRGAEAKKAGLIDHVEEFNAAYNRLWKLVRNNNKISK